MNYIQYSKWKDVLERHYVFRKELRLIDLTGIKIYTRIHK